MFDNMNLNMKKKNILNILNQRRKIDPMNTFSFSLKNANEMGINKKGSVIEMSLISFQ